MNLQFILLAAKATAEKADKEAVYNMGSAAQSYALAAKKYEQAAQLDPANKDKYLAMAEELKRKAATPAASPSSLGGTSGGGRQPSAGQPAAGQSSAGSVKTASQKASPAAAQNCAEGEVAVEEALGKLDKMVGLGEVKRKVNSWVSQIRVFKKRMEMGLPVPDGFSYHMVFTGNPGTGKTTVARFMADIYRGLGILKGGQLKETSRSDLVAGYEGQTAPKTREVVNEALGGVLFVDEAYTLSGNGRDRDPFGQEAIDELLKCMEDHRDELVVIVAGYTDQMEKFLQSNPGLKSRFNTVVHFDDYSAEELMKIFEGLCNKNKYVMTDGARTMLTQYFEKLFKERDKNFGNGRTVRNTFQQIVNAQSQRIDRLAQSGADISKEIVLIREEDVASGVNGSSEGGISEYEQAKATLSDASIYAMLSQNNTGGAAVAVCSRLEALLKFRFGLRGELYEMINSLRSMGGVCGNLKPADFDTLYKVRTFRNEFVHSGSAQSDITGADISDCLRIIGMLEK